MLIDGTTMVMTVLRSSDEPGTKHGEAARRVYTNVGICGSEQTRSTRKKYSCIL